MIKHRHSKTSPAPSNEMVLNVMPLQPREVTFSNQYIGYVTPVKSVEVVPQISGYLETVWVEGGQEVSAGDNLIWKKLLKWQPAVSVM